MQLFANKNFPMKTRLLNIFITTNSMAWANAILESLYKVLQRTKRSTTLKRKKPFSTDY